MMRAPCRPSDLPPPSNTIGPTVLERYFDNAATTPLDPRVLQAMTPFFAEQPGNPQSMHAWGIKARAAVEDARRQVASLIGAEDPSQVVFTSGATEANNWVLGAVGGGCVGPFEHSSVREPALALGYGVLENDCYRISPPKEDCRLVSLMTVNNEIGTIFEPESLRRQGAQVHTDATQTVGKIPFEVGDLDYVSFSAHKFHGPKGVGVLYVKNPAGLQPMLQGGEQEHGLRSGTLNVPGIVGMGAAARIAEDERETDFGHAVVLRDVVLAELPIGDGVQVLGGPKASPFILALSFDGLQGETILLELDARGYAIGSGAACSSPKAEPSHVLKALQLDDEWLRGTVRISFGRRNTAESARALGRVLSETMKTLLKMRK
jgi:cysteine desulfurase